MVSELALDDDVGQDWVGGRNAGADCEGVEEGQVWDEGPDQQGGCHPHGGHDRTKKDGQGFPLLFEIAAGELDAGKDQLHAENEAGEVEDDGIEVLLGAAIRLVSLAWARSSGEQGERWAYAYSKGLMRFAALGEKATPAKREITGVVKRGSDQRVSSKMCSRRLPGVTPDHTPDNNTTTNLQASDK